MGELEAIRRRHLLETADGNCAGSYSWDPEGWHRPQGHDLDLAVEDIGKLLAEVERLRGVVEERDRQIERMALRYGLRQEAALEGKDGD